MAYLTLREAQHAARVRNLGLAAPLWRAYQVGQWFIVDLIEPAPARDRW
jgi:hypothetical protein